MPNYSFNTFEVSGSSKEMENFYQKALKPSQNSEDGLVFSLDNLVPQPEKIKNTISPSSSAKGVKWMNVSKLQHRDGQISEILGEDVNLIPCENNTPEKCQYLIEEYGSDDWYDWNCKNWGTKWNCCVTEHEFTKTETRFSCFFESAWCPPDIFLFKLQEMFPKLDIKLLYELEGSNDCGVYQTERNGDTVRLGSYTDKIIYKSSDGRDIYFCDSDYEYKYVDSGECCDDIISKNPFE